MSKPANTPTPQVRVLQKTIVIPHDEAKQIQMALDPNADPQTLVKRFYPNTVPFLHTAIFDEHYEMNIKVCAPDDIEDGTKGNPLWTEAVLFYDGSELCCTEPADDYFGGWELEATVEKDGTKIPTSFRVEIIEAS